MPAFFGLNVSVNLDDALVISGQESKKPKLTLLSIKDKLASHKYLRARYVEESS